MCPKKSCPINLQKKKLSINFNSWHILQKKNIFHAKCYNIPRITVFCSQGHWGGGSSSNSSSPPYTRKHFLYPNGWLATASTYMYVEYENGRYQTGSSIAKHSKSIAPHHNIAKAQASNPPTKRARRLHWSVGRVQRRQCSNGASL